MEPIDFLRNEIKSYFPNSKELSLSSAYAQHRRYNFYFTITSAYPFLLYLNWDGEGDRFTLKCLQFAETGILDKLVAAYPESGSKAFNIGQPRTTVDFIYLDEARLTVTGIKGMIGINSESGEISVQGLMEYINPDVTA